MTTLSQHAAADKGERPDNKNIGSVFFHIFILIVVTFLCYANALHVPFVFDDHSSIVENPRIDNPSALLKASFWKHPRALVDLTFSLNKAWGGLDVVGYHLVNIAVHAVNVLLVYALTLNLLGALEKTGRYPPTKLPPRWFALTAALLFACHPIQTQAVTYIVQRYTAVAAMFFLASVLFYVKGRRALWARRAEDAPSSPSLGSPYAVPVFYFLLCLVSGLLAFLSKQNTASLPLMIVLVEYVVFDRSGRGWSRKALVSLPFLVLFVGFLFYNMGVFSAGFDLGRLLEDADRLSRETTAVDRWTYAVTQLRVICLYIGLLLAPVRQCVDYAYPFTRSFLSGWTPVAALILLSLATAAVAALRRNPLFSLAVGWFFIALSVESSLFPIRDALFEHRLYLPSVGFCWVAAQVFFFIAERWPKAGVIVAVAAIVALGAATHGRNRVWRDPVRLWQEAIERNPNNARAYNNLGQALMDRGENERAQKAFETALNLRPNSFDAQLNLGLSLARRGLIGEAVPAFQRALALRPENPKALYNTALAYHKMRLYDTARSYYERALHADPNMEKAALNLANLFVEQKQPDQAIEVLAPFVAAHPDAVDAVHNLAFIHLENGRPGEAEKAVETALARRPQSAALWLLKAELSLRLGRTEAARSALDKALKLSPENAEARALARRLLPSG
ncbi:MAG: tetratricopeptide repeat protein [Desulfosoma sp.]